MIFIIDSKTIYTYVFLFKRRLIKHVILCCFKILPPKLNQIKLLQIVFLFCCKNCIILIKYLSVGTNESIWAMWACVYVLRFLFSLNVWMGIHKALVFFCGCVSCGCCCIRCLHKNYVQHIIFVSKTDKIDCGTIHNMQPLHAFDHYHHHLGYVQIVLIKSVFLCNILISSNFSL